VSSVIKFGAILESEIQNTKLHLTNSNRTFKSQPTRQ